MSVVTVVFSGRGLCYELITCPEESYRLWCVVVCDLETPRIRAPYIYNISCLRVNNFTTNEDIATKFAADVPHCVKNVTTTNVLLFKFRCNIFIGVRIIKEDTSVNRARTINGLFPIRNGLKQGDAL